MRMFRHANSADADAIAAIHNQGIDEFPVYFDRTVRGAGHGRRLLEALVEAARERVYWKLVSRVFTVSACCVKGEQAKATGAAGCGCGRRRKSAALHAANG